jgi:hypothetical protein
VQAAAKSFEDRLAYVNRNDSAAGKAISAAEGARCAGHAAEFCQPAGDAARQLAEIAKRSNLVWMWDCQDLARIYEAQRQETERAYKAAARERELIGGSRSGISESYTSQKNRTGFAEPARKHTNSESLPAGDSGGAGGSEETVWTSSPAAVPDSGGAGGSGNVLPSSGFAEPARKHPIGTTPATTETRQQVCDPKSVDDVQLKALLGDPQVHTRITSLIAEEPSPRKAKTEQNLRAKRGRAPTDADIARSNSGMSPEAANAIGTVIGAGMGIGLSNFGRGGGSATPYGPAQRITPRSTPHP